MILFGMEYGQDLSRELRTSSKTLTQPCLCISTNEITNEILNSIDIPFTKNIIFSIHRPAINNITLEVKADMDVWQRFVENIEHLELRGNLVKKQWKVEHFECMYKMKTLYIGSTDYPLFDNEDISKLPFISTFVMGGYGVVNCSEKMKEWLKQLELRGGFIDYRV